MRQLLRQEAILFFTLEERVRTIYLWEVFKPPRLQHNFQEVSKTKVLKTQEKVVREEVTIYPGEEVRKSYQVMECKAIKIQNSDCTLISDQERFRYLREAHINLKLHLA